MGGLTQGQADALLHRGAGEVQGGLVGQTARQRPAGHRVHIVCAAVVPAAYAYPGQSPGGEVPGEGGQGDWDRRFPIHIHIINTYIYNTHHSPHSPFAQAHPTALEAQGRSLQRPPGQGEGEWDQQECNGQYWD